METANQQSEINYPYYDNPGNDIAIREHNQRMYDKREAYLAGYNASKWIECSEKLPEPEVRVFAIVKGYKDIEVMMRSWLSFEDDTNGYVWCNCYGDINGDAEFDDDYKVLAWHYLPSKPMI